MSKSCQQISRKLTPSEDLWETMNMTEPHEAGLNGLYRIIVLDSLLDWIPSGLTKGLKPIIKGIVGQESGFEIKLKLGRSRETCATRDWKYMNKHQHS